MMTESAPEKRTIKVFVSYSNKDMGLCTLIMRGLEAHLSQRKDYKYTIWSDGDILAGADWKAKITEQLNESDIALLLVDANFAASSFIGEKELPTFLAKKKEEFLMIPVLLREFAFTEFEYVSKLGFFKTYYYEYGFDTPTERDKFLPFEKLGENGDITNGQLNSYYHKLATHIHKAVSDKFSKPPAPGNDRPKSNSCVEFWNRTKERQYILGSTDPIISVSAPPFCGKSYLLKKLESEHDGWSKALLFSLQELQDISTSPIIRDGGTLLEYIAKKLDFQSFSDLRTSSQKMLLLIDDTHILMEKSCRDIELKCIREALQLIKTFDVNNIKIVFAGRYIASEDFKTRMCLRNVEHTILEPFVEEDIYEIIKYYANVRNVFANNHKMLYRQWAHGILSISSGHPQIIMKLVSYLLDNHTIEHLANGTLLSGTYFIDNEEQLFNDYVEPFLKKHILSVLNSDIEKNILVALSVFDSFDIRGFSVLQKHQIIDTTLTNGDNLSIFSSLLQLCVKNSHKKECLDPITTSFFRKYLKINGSRELSFNYAQVNKAAFEYFRDRWEASPDNDYYGLQYIHHHLQLADKNAILDNLTPIKDILEQKKKMYPHWGIADFETFLRSNDHIGRLTKEISLPLHELIQKALL